MNLDCITATYVGKVSLVVQCHNKHLVGVINYKRGNKNAKLIRLQFCSKTYKGTISLTKFPDYHICLSIIIGTLHIKVIGERR